MKDLERALALALVEPDTGRKKATPKQRARALQSVLQDINPQRKPELHRVVFDIYLDELKRAMDL